MVCTISRFKLILRASLALGAVTCTTPTLVSTSRPWW
jgi:hypothetical protein